MKARCLEILAALACLLPGTAGAAELLLQNDGWIDGGQVFCQGGFVAGEEAAATLGPVNGTFTVKKIQFLFCGSGTTETLTLKIYLDGGNPSPGSVIYSADYQATGTGDFLQEIDLSGENVVAAGGGSIRVSFLFQHPGYPSVSRDDDGIQAGRNWINAQGMGWIASSTLGLTGDWVIRAVVDAQQTEPDAGVEPDGSAGEDGGDPQPDTGPTTCSVSADCPGGHICRNNICVRACAESSDCLGGEVCDNGVCVPLCTDSSDCQGGQVCEGGVCVDVCTSNSDCQGGEVCQDQRCIEATTNGDGCGCRATDGNFSPIMPGLFLIGLLLLARRRK